MKSSIRIRYTLILVGIIGGVILSIFLLNNFFLESYVAEEKQDDIRETVELIEAYVKSDFVYGSDAEMELTRKTNANNIGVAVCTMEGFAPVLRYGSNYNLESFARRFQAYVSGEPVMADEILEKQEFYTLYRIYDTYLGSDQIECLGRVGNALYIISSSMEGIRESVQVTNEFLTYVGIGGIILGAILGYMVSRRMTRPILELASLSEQMARLNFDVRYQGKKKDEIGILGDSMNHMSERLHGTITALQSANLQLEKDIREKERIDEARRAFLANVSHDLKTPIALIQGYAEGLRDGIAEDPESREYYCDVIVDESIKMNHLVKRLLNLDEIESGEMQPEMELFDLVDVLRGMATSSTVLFKDKNCHMRLEVPESILVFADEFMIEEVLQNYISNAGNHVSDGGQIRIQAGHIREGWIRVSVYNTGQQIPAEDIEHIWDKFYKVDKARTRSYGGSGIGLSIVKIIISAHGGFCGVNNWEDGVEFWFELQEPDLDNPGMG